MKQRLDKLVVERNIAVSREKARALIIGGGITVDGESVTKPAALTETTADIRLHIARSGYASRGGIKLEGALNDFRFDPGGALCLDVGAATGGFTDCLLKHGARRVVAVDVGKNLLDYRLRTDPRVEVVEKFNARHIDRLRMDFIPDVVTVDVSFISLKLILSPLRGIIDNRTRILALIKPQFELEKPTRHFRGVVRDGSLHFRILSGMHGFFIENGYSVCGYSFSRLRGPKGNIEFFTHLRVSTEHPVSVGVEDIENVVAAAHGHFHSGDQAHTGGSHQ
jgi:23S rRNA (cytidine1920-2'-O)/16S rRNA (cytidine1409-2'-O)-methyltransferase